MGILNSTVSIMQYALIGVGCLIRKGHLLVCIIIAVYIIGSHDIQISTVVVTSQHAGEIEVTGQYLQRSTASGVLTITVSSKEIFYDLLPRQVPDLNFENIISGLPGGEHTISLFVVKEDGLPFERVATRPRSINVLNSK